MMGLTIWMWKFESIQTGIDRNGIEEYWWWWDWQFDYGVLNQFQKEFTGMDFKTEDDNGIDVQSMKWHKFETIP